MQSENFVDDQDFGKNEFNPSALKQRNKIHPRKENKVHQVRAQKQQPKEDVPMYNPKRRRFKIDQLPPPHTIHYLLHQTKVE